MGAPLPAQTVVEGTWVPPGVQVKKVWETGADERATPTAAWLAQVTIPELSFWLPGEAPYAAPSVAASCTDIAAIR
jgi:hypothetical protein